MPIRPIPKLRTYRSDTVRTDTVRKPIAYGRTPEEANKAAIDTVKRTRTVAENNKRDSQGNVLDDATIAVLRGGSKVKATPKKVPAPIRPVRNLKMKPLGRTPRGKSRGER